MEAWRTGHAWAGSASLSCRHHKALQMPVLIIHVVIITWIYDWRKGLRQLNECYEPCFYKHYSSRALSDGTVKQRGPVGWSVYFSFII